AGHALGIRLAQLADAVGLGVCQLVARIGFGLRFDRARLGIAFGQLDALRVRGFGFQRTLFDLLLTQRQHVLHRFFLRAGGDDLFALGGFGLYLAARLVG